MKHFILAIATLALPFGSMTAPANAATESTSVDQQAAKTLAEKISLAVKALGTAPSEKEVLEAIASATEGVDVSVVSAALKIVSADTTLSPAAKSGVNSAAAAAQLALNGDGTSTGGIGSSNGGTNLGQGTQYLAGGTTGGGGGGGY